MPTPNVANPSYVIIIDINAFDIELSRVAESAIFLRKDKSFWYYKFILL
jgi:hypothetical protein